MRKTFSLMIVVGLLLAASLPLMAGEEAAAVTVKGEILDMACYLGKGAKGAGHAGCAKACVKGGQPMGLLAEDGTVYLLVASHGAADAFDTAKEHAGEMVQVTGVTAARDGITMLEVQGVKKL